MRDDTAKRIGERARAARTRLGLNQEQVADRVGISAEVYGRLERGLNMPRIPTLMRICEVLRVEPNELLLRAEPRHVPERLSPDLRRLVSLLEDSDSRTVRRVTDVARWLRGARTPRR
jgi:transcriptional regulator with XRE-family HTH domain